MEKAGTPSPELLAGRRALEGMKGVVLLNDWSEYKSLNGWGLHCQLIPDVTGSGLIPSSTDWYVLVSKNYPWGFIKFFPAKENGITQTFPHQNYNGLAKDEFPWRLGNLCLNTPSHALRSERYDIEPYSEHKRLRWHFQRALEWLKAADRNELALPGDPFELPQFSEAKDVEFISLETPETFQHWQQITEVVGQTDLLFIGNKKKKAYVVKAFGSLQGSNLLIPEWGSLNKAIGNKITGLWLRIPSTLALQPWQAPYTWGELREVCNSQGIDLDRQLRTLLRANKNTGGQILLVGFPVPERIGQLPKQIHWQALKLPLSLYGVKNPVRGFRQTEEYFWKFNRERNFRNETPIYWIESSNWAAAELSSRGALPKELSSKKILVLGAGALGSAIAELLARAGAYRMLILDEDKLEAGNLVRHTLTLEELYTNKAVSISTRLNNVSPHADVKAQACHFPPSDGSTLVEIGQCQIVIDCTASDEVLYQLEKFEWGSDRLFISISFGLGARRLFCLSSFGSTFPLNHFRNLITPWLQREFDENGDAEMPREGIGCWNPVFPARSDDVWMLAAVAVKYIEKIGLAASYQSELIVFEQHYEDGLFVGVRQVERETLND